MSSVKRRKIEGDAVSQPVKMNKTQNTFTPVPATASASPEPTAQSTKSTIASDAEPEKDAPVQKTFKDLV